MGRETPNPKNVAIVDEVKGRLESATTIIATEYRGLNVPQQAELRAKVKEAGGELKIYKNTLVRRAAGEAGVSIDEHLFGPTALALVEPDGDSAAMAKALQDFADDNPALVIKGGVMDGEALDAGKVKALSKIPPRDVLLSQIAGLFAAPMSKLASLIKAPLQDFASLVKALEEKGGGADNDGAAAAAEDSADAPDSDEAPASDESPSADAETSEVAADAVADDAPAEAPAEEAAPEEVSPEEVSPEEVSTEEASTEEATAEDAAAQEEE